MARPNRAIARKLNRYEQNKAAKKAARRAAERQARALIGGLLGRNIPTPGLAGLINRDTLAALGPGFLDPASKAGYYAGQLAGIQPGGGFNFSLPSDLGGLGAYADKRQIGPPPLPSPRGPVTITPDQRSFQRMYEQFHPEITDIGYKPEQRNTLSGVWGQPPAGPRTSSFTPDIGGLPTETYTPGETAIQQAAQRPARPSVPPPNAAMASPETRMGPTSGLPGLSDYERSRLAQVDAQFSQQARAALRNTVDPEVAAATVNTRAAPKVSRLGVPDDVGGIRAPAKQQTERLQPTTVGGPPAEVAAAQPDRLAGTSVPGIRNVPAVQTASTAPVEISRPVASAAMIDARHPAAPASIAGSLADTSGMTIAADDPGNVDIADAADEAVDAANTDITPDVETAPATRRDVKSAPVADDEALSGAFPAAPAAIEATPNRDLATKALKAAGLGILGGGIPGAVLGGATGLVQGLLSRGPGFDAVVPDPTRFSTGTGLRGINAALAGPKGATGTSLSNPGMSVTSLGTGQSLRRSDKYGWTEVVGPDGSVAGIRYDNPDKKGLLGKISNYFDSRYGGQRSQRSISPAAARAIGAGKGGLY